MGASIVNSGISYRQGRRALFAYVACIGLFLGTFTAFDQIYNSFPEPITTAILVYGIVCSMFLLLWIWCERKVWDLEWQLNDQGISMLWRGQLKQKIAWQDIRMIRTHPSPLLLIGHAEKMNILVHGPKQRIVDSILERCRNTGNTTVVLKDARPNGFQVLAILGVAHFAFSLIAGAAWHIGLPIYCGQSPQNVICKGVLTLFPYFLLIQLFVFSAYLSSTRKKTCGLLVAVALVISSVICGFDLTHGRHAFIHVEPYRTMKRNAIWWWYISEVKPTP